VIISPSIVLPLVPQECYLCISSFVIALWREKKEFWLEQQEKRFTTMEDRIIQAIHNTQDTPLVKQPEFVALEARVAALEQHIETSSQ